MRFKIRTPEESQALAEAADTLFLDIWESTRDWVDIRIAKDMMEPLLGLLPSSLHDAHSPLMHDLAQAVLESYPSGSGPQWKHMTDKSHHGYASSSGHDTTEQTRELFFREYQPLSVMTPWMKLMASLFPSHVQLISIGTSYEGRDIHALRIGVRSANDTEPSKPRHTILVSGGSHAREWIATAAANYAAYSLITRYGKYPVVTRMVDEFDWVFIPSLNPDGYAFTWEHDRLWRKNRQQTNVRFCPGIDLDRSFGFGWDGESQTDNPCAESYAGTEPFEGFEAHRLAAWARNETENNNVEFSAFVDLHSYSQEILYPYSYSCDAFPPTLENLEELAMGLVKAIRLTHNHGYAIASACKGHSASTRHSKNSLWPKLELTGGSALDWFYHELQVRYSYQIKLRDTGSYGFLLPSTQILPTGQELFSALLDMGTFLLSNKGIELPADESIKSAYASFREPEGPSLEQHEEDWDLLEDAGDEDIEDVRPVTDLRRSRRKR